MCIVCCVTEVMRAKSSSLMPSGSSPNLRTGDEEGRTIAFFLRSGHSTAFFNEGWGGQWAKGAASREQTEKHVREEGGLSVTG